MQEKDEYGISKGMIKSVLWICNYLTWLNCDDRPFIIDLESTNGTYVNDERIPESRYYELKASDGESRFLASKD